VLGSVPREALTVLRGVSGVSSLANAYVQNVVFARDAVSEPSMWEAEFVSTGYFDTLGIRARIGRLFTNEETDTRGNNVALLSEAMWIRTFEHNDSVIGQTIFLNGVPFSVVGVIDDYAGWGVTRVGTVDVRLPIDAESAVTPSRSISTLVGKKDRALLPAVLEDRLRSSYQAFAAQLPGRASVYVPTVYIGLNAFLGDKYRERIARVLPFVLGGTFLLMMSACANVSNLLLARGSRRAREFAIPASGWFKPIATLTEGDTRVHRHCSSQFGGRSSVSNQCRKLA